MTGALLIRPARLQDLDAIHHLETTVFDLDQLSRRSLRRFLTAPTTDTVVAATQDGLFGYAMIAFRQGSRVGRLFSLAVDRARVRQGIGSLLLRACEHAAWRRGSARLRLEVRGDNAAAIALYRRAGFTLSGQVADYYEDGAPALRFDKIETPVA